MKIHLPKEKLKKLGVEIVYLFGSRAQKTVGLLSDFDFGIVFKEPEKYRDNTLDIYSELYDIFVKVLPKNYLKKRFTMREHEVDIVFLQFAPFSLQFSVIKNGGVLYEHSKENRFRYEEEVMKKVADLRYFYDIRYKAILERI